MLRTAGFHSVSANPRVTSVAWGKTGPPTTPASSAAAVSPGPPFSFCARRSPVSLVINYERIRTGLSREGPTEAPPFTTAEYDQLGKWQADGMPGGLVAISHDLARTMGTVEARLASLNARSAAAAVAAAATQGLGMTGTGKLGGPSSLLATPV